MVSRVWLINAVLTIGLILCSAQVWDVWRMDNGIPKERLSNESDGAGRLKAPLENRLLAEADYQSVVARNLFSPDRKEASPEVKPVVPVDKDIRISGEKVILYGVVLFGNYKVALINNIGNQKTGGKYRWVKEGDQIENLNIKEILPDQLLLVDSEGIYRARLYDPEKPRGDTPAFKKSAESKPSVISTGERPAAAQPSVSSGNVSSKPSSQPGAAAENGNGGYTIIQTPFGAIKRKIK